MKFSIIWLILGLIFTIDAKEVNFAQIDARLIIEASQAADLFDHTNEYEVAFSIRDKKSGEILGHLKGSTAVPGQIFGGWERVTVGEQEIFETSIKLPTSLLNQINLGVYIVEHDLIVPIPGPCCLYFSNNDILFNKVFDLTGFFFREKSLSFERKGGSASIEMVKVDWGKTDISSLIEFQFDNILRKSSSSQKSFIKLIDRINQ